MIKRGTILRDTSAGPGLLAVDGDHYQFSSDTLWRSTSAPAPGMAVSVEFAPDCRILSIVAINDREISNGGQRPHPRQSEALLTATEAVSTSVFKNDGLPSLVARLGVANLVASSLLLIGWILLTSMSVQTLFGQMNFTFWDLLGFLNSGSAWEAVSQGRPGMSAGAYGLLAILVIAAPYLQNIWRDKRASLFGVFPLFFMLYVAFMVRGSLHQAFGATAEGALAEVQRQAQEEIMKAVSLGFGAYFSALVCAYFAVIGATRFLQSHGINTEVVENPNSVNQRVEL